MPQPFSFRPGSGPTLLAGPAAISARPDLAVQIALVSAHWSVLEWRLSLVYLALLRGEQPAALAVYHLLIDRRLRQQAIIAAAETQTDADQLAAIKKLFTRIEALGGERNRIVHASWCAISTFPDSLFRRNDADVDRMLFRNYTL